MEDKEFFLAIKIEWGIYVARKQSPAGPDVTGTAWLTASNFISRLLGAVYIIPWYIWMGAYAAKANGLFTMGYNIYAWFLLVSTAGIPVAVAKQVAKYNTMREEEHSFALIRSFLGFMTGLGLVLL